MNRNAKIRAAEREAMRGNAKAKAKVRQRRAQTRPWKVLAEEWREETWRVFGKEVVVEPWGLAEGQSARRYLKEVDLEKAIEVTKRFIRWWSEKGKEGLPGFRYFWTVRKSIQAMVDGTAEDSLQAKRAKQREYDSANDDVDGWGDIFEDEDAG